MLTNHDIGLEVDSTLLRTKLSSVNRNAGNGEFELWERYLEVLCEEVNSLRIAMESAEPRIIVDEKDSTKSSVLNHLTLEQTALLASIFEIIVCWSIHPVLSFQIPAANRTAEFLSLAKKLPEKFVLHLSATLLLSFKAVKTLYDCLTVRELAILVVDGNMVDIIPGLVKFGFEKTVLPPTDFKWANGAFKALISSSPVPSSSMARLLLLHLSLKPENPVAIRVLSSAIYMLLCERKNGLIGVLSAFLDTKSGVIDMEAVVAAAKTIAIPPKSIEIEAYFLKLCPQLLTIMRAPRTSQGDKYISCASEIFRAWSSSHPNLTLKHWVAPALSPFLPFLSLFMHNQRANSQDKVSQYLKEPIKADEKRIGRPKPRIQLLEEIVPTSPSQASASVPNDLWNLTQLSAWNSTVGVVVPASVLELTLSNAVVILFSSAESSFIQSFEPVVPIIARILSRSSGKKDFSSLEKDSTDFVQRYFKLCEPHKALEMLEYIALRNYEDWRGVYGKEGQGGAKILSYDILESSGLCIVARILEDNSVPLDVRQSSSEVIQLLKVLDGELSGVFFLKLLEDLFSSMTISKSLSDDSVATSDMSFDERMALLQTVSERQIRQMHILMPLLEEIGPSVLRNTVQICLFIKSMLDSDEDEELLVLALTILKEILALSLVSRSEADILLVELLTPLKTLFHHKSEFISGLSQHCFEEIQNGIQSNLDSTKVKDEGIVDPKLSEGVSEKLSKRKWVLNPHASSVDEALKMIANPLIPIRAGGLIQLRRFLLREDKDAMDKIPFIMDTFVTHLANSDSYVYLGAIQGLSAIADVKFDLAMPKLVEQYRNPRKSLEIRLNVGESILQVARRLAQALPKYASEFFSFLLVSAQKDPEALMRASSLSNIGEICELLRFGLIPYIEEIMAMIYDILLAEKDSHVRRGALHLIRNLFKGLSKDILLVIPSHLQRLAALLESIEASSDDLILREHARDALELYRDGIESAIVSASTASTNFLEPTGFYESLRIIK